MTVIPNRPRRIWLRSFYGFSPEDDGYIGWTEPGPRDRMLGMAEAGDLFMIYGATTKQTAIAQRNRVLGFLEIGATPIRDVDKASDEGMRRKRANGWEGKWSYAIPVVRAWRADESVLLQSVAPITYRSEAGQAIAVWNPPLEDSEVDLALRIKVSETAVFGEPEVTQSQPNVELLDFYRPSRAVKGGFGPRTSNYEDGPTKLYLAIFEGDHLALLGRPVPFADKSVMIKIGVSNDPTRRLDELNAGFPPASLGRWGLGLVSRPFENKEAAERAEQTFKDSAMSLRSLGREFFVGKREDALSIFASVPGVSRFGG